MPSYDEYSVVYRAHWVLCSSSFSMQLIAAMIALKDEPRRAICSLLIQANARDNMNLEALTRFLNTFMDQYSPDLLLSFFEPSEQVAFVETLLILVVYEPIRDVLLRICNEVADVKLDARPILGVMLYQLSPLGLLSKDHAAGAIVSANARARVVNDQPHERFSRMVFTCDLLTDLIHEGRAGSLGFAIVHELATNEVFGHALLDSVLFDLAALPSIFANEAYTLKVLNSLLQQTQCGCVAKHSEGEGVADSNSQAASITTATGSAPSDTSRDSRLDTDAHESPHDDLPPLWKLFLAQLPHVLQFLALPPNTHFKSTHMQLVYLMLPVLNVACSVADRSVIQARTLEALLEFIVRFPESNILHCAISRLFIVALEDSPFLFGKELPAYRSATDPLRMHLLLNGAFQLVLDVYDRYKVRSQAEGVRRNPPPAFLDIAISFDQSVTNAVAYSASMFGTCPSLLDRWKDFRSSVLLPTQTVWEEQYQVAGGGSSASNSGAADSPRGPESAEVEASLTLQQLIDHEPKLPVSPPLATDAENATSIQSVRASESEISPRQSFAPAPTSAPSSGPSIAVVAAAAAAEDVPTPLSALYSDEEKRMMLHVETASDT